MWARRSPVLCFPPEQEHVDALVGHAATAQGPQDAPAGVGGGPRLEPGAYTLLQVGDDAVGDAGVDVFPHVSPPEPRGVRLALWVHEGGEAMNPHKDLTRHLSVRSCLHGGFACARTVAAGQHSG
jgi:hypothetical protein